MYLFLLTTVKYQIFPTFSAGTRIFSAPFSTLAGFYLIIFLIPVALRTAVVVCKFFVFSLVLWFVRVRVWCICNIIRSPLYRLFANILSERKHIPISAHFWRFFFLGFGVFVLLCNFVLLWIDELTQVFRLVATTSTPVNEIKIKKLPNTSTRFPETEKWNYGCFRKWVDTSR